MSFTAKAADTKELVLVHTEAANEQMENHHDATLPLRPELMYQGNLLVGSYVGNSFYVEYTEQALKWFKGSELEEVPGDIRLIPMHNQVQPE